MIFCGQVQDVVSEQTAWGRLASGKTTFPSNGDGDRDQQPAIRRLNALIGQVNSWIKGPESHHQSGQGGSRDHAASERDKCAMHLKKIDSRTNLLSFAAFLFKEYQWHPETDVKKPSPSAVFTVYHPICKTRLLNALMNMNSTHIVEEAFQLVAKANDVHEFTQGVADLIFYQYRYCIFDRRRSRGDLKDETESPPTKKTRLNTENGKRHLKCIANGRISGVPLPTGRTARWRWPPFLALDPNFIQPNS